MESTTIRETEVTNIQPGYITTAALVANIQEGEESIEVESITVTQVSTGRIGTLDQFTDDDKTGLVMDCGTPVAVSIAYIDKEGDYQRLERRAIAEPGTPGITSHIIEYSILATQQHIRSDRHPAIAYLNAQATSGQRTQRVALDKAAHIMSDGVLDHMTFPWAQLRYQHVATLRTRLQEEDLKFTYINKILAAVRGVASECWKLELKDADGQLLMQDSDLIRIREVKNVKGQALLAGRCLTMTELRSIGEACQDGSLRGIRDAALFALLAAAGLRRGEPVSIDISDYNAQDGSVVIRGGKGNKDRIAWIVDGNKRFIDKWLEFRPAVAGPLILPLIKGGVFCMREMTHENVYKIIMHRAELAGVECSVHDLRRTFATISIDQGANIAALQSQLGHSSAAQTLRYDRSGEEEKRRLSNMMRLSLGETL